VNVDNTTEFKLPSLSVLIINWNSKDYVRSCLTSIAQNSHETATQIIVVDGASFDGCDKILKDEFPYVKFVQSTKNIGFGRANNLGFQSVTSEYVLLLNPDTEIKSRALETLLEAHLTLPNVGATGARLLNSDQTLQTSSVQALPTPINQALDSNFLRNIFPNSKLWSTNGAYETNQPTAVQALSGACILMRSDLYKKMGGFTPDYFMYAEDMDLCMKINREGLKLYHVPTAEITHHGGGSSHSQPSIFSEVMKRDALNLYMKANHGRGKALSYRTLQSLSSILRLPPLVIRYVVKSNPDIKISIKKWHNIFLWSCGGNQWAKKMRTESLNLK
jgi:GT2 family glycosyltransferase